MSNTNNTYNGWTNYATWRVNLEMFDGGDWSGNDAESLKDFAESIVYGSTDNESLGRDYALAFLSDVNWYEIANHYNEDEAA